jgi:hypothetical protein
MSFYDSALQRIALLSLTFDRGKSTLITGSVGLALSGRTFPLGHADRAGFVLCRIAG